LALKAGQAQQSLSVKCSSRGPAAQPDNVHSLPRERTAGFDDETGHCERRQLESVADVQRPRRGWRLILQPRAEIEASAQSIPEIGVGVSAGLTDIEIGLRLRYEIEREFAPYVGVECANKVGETARLATAAGDRPSGVSYVAGIRFWF
jgi:uncharacterized protein involved in copper resistance